MAKLNGDFDFTGKLGNLSFYKMKGCNKTVVRRPGGADKKKMKRLPSCKVVLQNSAEFGGSSTAASIVRNSMPFLSRMGDTHLHGSLTAMCKKVLELDNVNPKGQRSVLFSQHPYALQGFDLTTDHTFDSIIKNPVTCEINRETGTATVHIPALTPGINFFLPWAAVEYSLIATAGVIGNTIFNGIDYQPLLKQPDHVIAETPARQSIKGCDATMLTLQLARPQELTDQHTIVVAIGIEACIITASRKGPVYETRVSSKILAVG